MLIAPLRISCWRAFVEASVLAAKNKPDVDVWMLLLDVQMFGPVLTVQILCFR